MLEIRFIDAENGNVSAQSDTINRKVLLVVTTEEGNSECMILDKNAALELSQQLIKAYGAV